MHGWFEQIAAQQPHSLFATITIIVLDLRRRSDSTHNQWDAASDQIKPDKDRDEFWQKNKWKTVNERVYRKECCRSKESDLQSIYFKILQSIYFKILQSVYFAYDGGIISSAKCMKYK